MYKLIGIRKNGMKIYKEYHNKNIAEFEYEVTLPVVNKLQLLDNDIIISEFEYKEPETITYLLQGQTAFNTIRKTYTKEEIALIEFKQNIPRSDYLVLYKNVNGVKEQINIYIKGVA